MPFKNKDKQKAYYDWWSKNKGRSPEAKERQREYDRQRAKVSPRKEKIAGRKQKYTAKISEGRKIIYKKNKEKVIGHYSEGKMECACCQEKHIEFLGIDHINGGGNKERKEKKYTSTIQYLIRNNFPEGYRVLCHNCNLSRGFYKYCPHERVSEEKLTSSVQESLMGAA